MMVPRATAGRDAIKLRSEFKIGGKVYAAGQDVPWFAIYPFFLVHMLMFGASGFAMSYAKEPPPLPFIYFHGGFAILVYTVFYVAFFGRDEVKWMFINAALSLLAIYTQVAWLLSLFGRNIADYPLYMHATPFLYYVLYTFLLRQAILDLAGARDDEEKKRSANNLYVAVSAGLSIAAWLA